MTFCCFVRQYLKRLIIVYFKAEQVNLAKRTFRNAEHLKQVCFNQYLPSGYREGEFILSQTKKLHRTAQHVSFQLFALRRHLHNQTVLHNKQYCMKILFNVAFICFMLRFLSRKSKTASSIITVPKKNIFSVVSIEFELS